MSQLGEGAPGGWRPGMPLNIQQTTGQPMTENDRPKASSAAPRRARWCGHRGWVKGSPSLLPEIRTNGVLHVGKRCGGTGGSGDPMGGGRPGREAAHIRSAPFWVPRGSAQARRPALCPLPPGLPRRTQLPCAAALVLGTDGTAAQGLDPQSQHCSQLTWKNLNHGIKMF